MNTGDPTDMREDDATVPTDTANVAAAPAAIRLRDLSEWRGKDLMDSDGERIGPLEDVYYDIETDEPMFVSVKEGFLSRHLTFVPLPGAMVGPDLIHVAVSISDVKEAPNIDLSGDQLSADDESVLYHHYRLNYSRVDGE